MLRSTSLLLRYIVLASIGRSSPRRPTRFTLQTTDACASQTLSGRSAPLDRRKIDQHRHSDPIPRSHPPRPLIGLTPGSRVTMVSSLGATGQMADTVTAHPGRNSGAADRRIVCWPRPIDSHRAKESDPASPAGPISAARAFSLVLPLPCNCQPRQPAPPGRCAGLLALLVCLTLKPRAPVPEHADQRLQPQGAGRSLLSGRSYPFAAAPRSLPGHPPASTPCLEPTCSVRAPSERFRLPRFLPRAPESS